MAKRGVHVVPTYPGLRHPALLDWQDLATTDLDTISKWGNNGYPDYNCCCVAKSDGVYMLDIDDLAAAQKRGMPQLPQTLTSKTPGGGLHVFLQHNALSRSLGNANVYEGEGKEKKKIVEVKGHNAAVCAPGCAELKVPDRIEEIPLESDEPTDCPVLGTEEEL
jgi:hypothetical protein